MHDRGPNERRSHSSRQPRRSPCRTGSRRRLAEESLDDIETTAPTSRTHALSRACCSHAFREKLDWRSLSVSDAVAVPPDGPVRVLHWKATCRRQRRATPMENAPLRGRPSVARRRDTWPLLRPRHLQGTGSAGDSTPVPRGRSHGIATQIVRPSHSPAGRSSRVVVLMRMILGNLSDVHRRDVVVPTADHRRVGVPRLS